MWEENAMCPDCPLEFEDIAKLRKLDMKYQFKCLICGKCLKEKIGSPHACVPDHTLKRHHFRLDAPTAPGSQQSTHQLKDFSNSYTPIR